MGRKEKDMKRIVLSSTLGFIILILFQNESYSQMPTQVWVSQAYDSTTAGWGVTHFAIIQKGIHAIADSGTVNVAAGSYYENLQIRKSLNLLGENAETTIIDGLDSSNTVSITGVDQGFIKGFTITNSGENGLYLRSGTNFVIENNIFSNYRTSSCFVEQSQYITVERNRIAGNGAEGLRFEKSHSNRVINNFINNNWPIVLGNSTGNIIELNEIIAESHSGMALYNSGNNQILDNTFDGVQSNCTLIRHHNSSNNLIAGNTFRNCRYGIYIAHSDRVIAVNNEFIDFLDSGIGLYHTNDSQILGNDLYTENNMRHHGILLFGASSRNTILGNRIDGATKGICLFYDSNDNWIENNEIVGAERGVILDLADGNTILRNNITAMTIPGFDNGDNNWFAGTSGNYWSDYTGRDRNGDLIGETPYSVSPLGLDEYPSIKPFEILSVPLPALSPIPLDTTITDNLWITTPTVWDGVTKTFDSGIYIDSNASLTIRNSTITFTRASGISALSDAGLFIYNSKIYANGTTLHLNENSEFAMEDSELYHGGAWGGIIVFGKLLSFKNNLIYEMWGLVFNCQDNGFPPEGIIGNTILNTFDGIALSSSSQSEVSEVKNNRIINCINTGILVDKGKHTIINNTIKNAWEWAIQPNSHYDESRNENNLIYNNNFHSYQYSGVLYNIDFPNTWHFNNSGNFWSDYLDRYPYAEAHPRNPNIWDTPYHIRVYSHLEGSDVNVDPYPLINPVMTDTRYTLPATPQLIAPANQAINIVADPVLFWNPDPNAASYRLVVATDSTFRETVVNQDQIVGNQYQVHGLSSLTKYYWRVIASNEGGYSGWSEKRYFTVAKLPGEN